MIEVSATDSARTLPFSASKSSGVMAEALSLNVEWNLHFRKVSLVTRSSHTVAVDVIVNARQTYLDAVLAVIDVLRENGGGSAVIHFR